MRRGVKTKTTTRNQKINAIQARPGTIQRPEVNQRPWTNGRRGALAGGSSKRSWGILPLAIRIVGLNDFLHQRVAHDVATGKFDERDPFNVLQDAAHVHQS